MKQVAILLGMIVFGYLCGLVIAKKAHESSHEEPPKPKIKMDSVCSTPIGHPVYKYQDGENTIYVITRHSDGYPINITVIKN